MFDSATGTLYILQVVSTQKYGKNNEQSWCKCSEISCILNSAKIATSAFWLHVLCRLAAAAEGKGPKIIAKQEESSEEEEEDEELTPEERGRHALFSLFCFDFSYK